VQALTFFQKLQLRADFLNGPSLCIFADFKQKYKPFVFLLQLVAAFKLKTEEWPGGQPLYAP
jgi:hypothetical protein